MRGLAIAAGVVCLLAVQPAAAGAQVAAKIVFASDRDGTYDIWTMNPDGTGQVKLAGTPTADEFSPVPSADGTKIAFIRGAGATSGEPEGDLLTMNADGTGEQTLTFGANDPSWSPIGDMLSFGSVGHSARDGELWRISATGNDAVPLAAPARDNLGTSWSPDAQRIAFYAQIGDAFPQNEGIWTVKPDATGLTQLTQTADGGDRNPDWSPNGAKVAFDRFGSLWTMNADGTAQAALTNPTVGEEPDWSLDGSQLAFMRPNGDYEIHRANANGTAPAPLTNNTANDIDPAWMPVYSGYARPRGATPLRVSLVPAYRPCPATNRMHGPPLAYPSCNPPQQWSNYVTVGTADSNGFQARSESSLLFETIVGNPGTAADESDVRIQALINDVRAKPSLADYTGDVHMHVMIRVTDRDNSGTPPTGTLEIEIQSDIPCAATADPQEGSTCPLNTSWDAILPGFVKEGKRTIWALKKIEIHDGGADGDGNTPGDNMLFAVPGVFIP